MKMYNPIIILLFNFLFFTQEQKMTPSEISTFKASVEKEAKSIKSLKTDFVQYKHLSFLSKEIETSGKMYLKSPDLLKWEYTNPYKYSIIFKNNKIYINDQGKKSTIDAGNSKMFEKINKLIAGSVSGNLFDEQEFTIQYYKSTGFYITKLTPKTATIKKYIKVVELYFPIGESTVSQVKLIEPSDDFTKIVFKNKLLNAKVEDSVFNQ